jgi:PleD family two-component response regulator
VPRLIILETDLPDFDGYALERLSRVCPRDQTTLVLFAAHTLHSYDLIGSLSLPTATA